MTPTLPSDAADLVTELRSHAAWLSRLAFQLVRDEDEAADIVQDTWIASLRHPPALDRPLRPWLAEVVKNFAYRRRRGAERRRRREAAAFAPDPAPVAGTSPATAAAVAERTAGADVLLERAELHRLISEVVVALDEPFRSTLLQRFYDGLSSAEIARAAGAPAGTVRWRLKEALSRLRRELDRRHGGDRRAWVALLFPAGSAAPLLPASTVALAPPTKGVVAAAVLGLLVAGGVALWLSRAREGDSDAGARPLSAYQWVRRGNGHLRVFGAPPATTGAIGGVVRDKQGRPVPAATATMAAAAAAVGDQVTGGTGASPSVSAVTGPDGRFSLPDVPDGVYRVTVTAAGFMPAHAERVELGPGGRRREDLALVLDRGGVVLRGRVGDAGGGDLPQAVVVLDDGEGPVQTRAGDGGQYTVSLRPGPYHVRVTADGYAPHTADITVAEGATGNFLLQPAARISGRVVHGPGGPPVPGAVVRAEPDGISAEAPVHMASDAGGEFVFSGLGPGQYRISAVHGGRAGFHGPPVILAPAGAAGPILVSLEPAFSVRGRVRDPARRPVADAAVFMYEADADRGAIAGKEVTRTGPDGRFRVDGVLPGRYFLRAEKPPLAPSPSVSAVVGEASVDDVDLALLPGLPLEVRVRTQDGAPVAGADVIVTVSADRATASLLRARLRDRSGTDGRCSFQGVPSGPMRITVEHRTHGAIGREHWFHADGERAVDVTYGAPAFVSGRVRWADDGGAAVGAVVRWIGRPVNLRAVATVASDGTFRLGPLAAGGGSVQTELAGDGAAMLFTLPGPGQRRLNLPAGETSGIELALHRADQSLHGLVLDERGQPKRGVAIKAVIERTFLKIPEMAREGATTDDDGRFQIERLQAVPHVVFAMHPEYPTMAIQGVRPGRAAPPVVVRLARGGAVEGRVVDGAGAAVGSFNVSLVSPEGDTTVAADGPAISGDRVRQSVRDPSGVFTLAGVRAGRYDLVVTTPDGAYAETRGLTVEPGGRRTGLRLVLAPTGVVVGRVLDAATGQPLRGRTVTIVGSGEITHAATDDDGQFVLERQVPGRTVRFQVVSSEEHVRENREVIVRPPPERTEMPPILLLRGYSPTFRPATGGAGLVIGAMAGGPVVKAVAAGSAAARAGFVPGDRLLAIDGRDVGGLGPNAVAYLIHTATEAGRGAIILHEGAGRARRQTALGGGWEGPSAAQP